MGGSPASGRGLVAAVALLGALCAGCGSGVDDATDGDSTPPSVVSTSPGAGADVAPDSRVTVAFDEDVEPTSVSEGVRLIGVAGVAEYDASVFTAEFVADEPLPPGGHTLSIRGVSDLAGNSMTTVVTVSFTVR